jgi:uncharacterized protein YqgV (UPF0045/DUF77 family)
MRIENFLKNLSQEELVEVQSVVNKLIVKEQPVTTGKTNIQKLIDALVEIKSRGLELTMDGMITMLENNLDAEKKQLKECWETAHQAGRFEGKGIAEENWQAFDDYYNEC